MKFPVDKCWDCGLDLTTAEPAEVTYPGNEQALGTCPGCGKLYFMLEVTPPSPEPESISEPEVEVGEPEAPEPESVVEPEAKELVAELEPKARHRRASEPEPELLPEE